jgi:hypothetical protein
MNVATIAAACHEANKVICEANGDFSQKHWDEAEVWQKESAIRGVNYVIEHPDVTPEMQHQAWCNDKIADGWVYGPEKNAEKKEHHCLVPYAELAASQTIKDHVFSSICKAMIPYLKEEQSTHA